MQIADNNTNYHLDLELSLVSMGEVSLNCTLTNLSSRMSSHHNYDYDSIYSSVHLELMDKYLIGRYRIREWRPSPSPASDDRILVWTFKKMVLFLGHLASKSVRIVHARVVDVGF